jgi:hypothetical protein
MDTKINSAEIVITLGDDEIVLKPSLRAMTTISRQFNGLAGARNQLVAENFDAVTFIIRNGSGMDDRSARNLGDRVYENGVTGDLLVGLIRYVAILGNGGKPIDETGAGNSSGEETEGN